MPQTIGYLFLQGIAGDIDSYFFSSVAMTGLEQTPLLVPLINLYPEEEFTYLVREGFSSEFVE